MQKSARAVTELASRQAELVSDDDLSSSSSSSSEHNRTLSKSVTPEASSESEEEGGQLLGRAELHEELRERINSAQEQMQYPKATRSFPSCSQLMQSFDEEQLQRYETFRRVGLPRPNIKRLIQRITDQTNVHANCIIVVAGIAKVFIGELVESAVEVAEERAASGIEPSEVDSSGQLVVGPLRPSHIQEAHRRLQRNHALPSSPPFNPLFYS